MGNALPAVQPLPAHDAAHPDLWRDEGKARRLRLSKQRRSKIQVLSSQIAVTTLPAMFRIRYQLRHWRHSLSVARLARMGPAWRD